MRKFKILVRSIILFASIGIFSQTVHAGLLYPYHRLATKNLDDMNKLVQDKIKESRKSRGNKTIPLKEALQAVFSRPNDDGLIEKVLSPLRNELEDIGSWEKSLKALIKEAVGALNNPKAFRNEALVSYALFLENILVEFRPRISEDFEKSIFEDIQAAQIEITSEATKERKLKLMKEQFSPSKVAEISLKEAAIEREKEKEKEKEKQKEASESASQKSDSE